MCPLFYFENYYSRRWLSIKKQGLMLNEDIRVTEIRLIDDTGKMVGVVPTKYGIEMSVEKDLDLVMISPKAVPPVCRIMDYGKYLFDKAKSEKEAKKKQKVIVVKEIWLKPKIEQHDFNFKVKNANKFLLFGNKVKVSVRFRGREMQYTKIGRDVLEKFIAALTESSTVEGVPRLQGRSMTIVLNPIEKKR